MKELVVVFDKVLWGKNRILCDLNDYIITVGTHYQKGGKLKKDMQYVLSIQIRQQNKDKIVFSNNIGIDFLFYEVDSARDFDNISAVGHKFILDALQDAKVITNDKNIIEITDKLFRNSKEPKIAIRIREVEE